MQCHHYDAHRCRSCTLLPVPYPDQVSTARAQVARLLDLPVAALEPTFSGPQSGFRNKAKLVVSPGTPPTLGIVAPDGTGTDLADCPLYPLPLQQAAERLRGFLGTARLVPYDLTTRRGELKHLLVTISPDGELMVRFVLRSTESVLRIRKHLPDLLHDLPTVRVVSVNLLPQHKAVTEGAEEIVLTDQETLPMRLGAATLHLRPQSFFQTNTAVATALYQRARQWTDGLGTQRVWDLYCGVGGFALHLAAPNRRVVGVETSAEAVASARQSAAEADLTQVTQFHAQDATEFARQALAAGAQPDLVVVNPPRRGIGAELADLLEYSTVNHVLYSTCNPRSLAADLARMPSLQVRRAQVLDMFPHTGHDEVLVLLGRGPSGTATAQLQRNRS